MASASSTSAKILFVDSKLRLAERVQVNVNNAGSICRQILRGSRSADLLSHSSRNMALQEQTIENTQDNLHKLTLLITHLGFQQQSIEKSSIVLENVKEQLTLEWSGGAEALFGNIKERKVSLEETPKCTESNVWTLRILLYWLQHESGFLSQRPELFFSEDTVRPGILVLINDADWELLGQLDYSLQNDDNIVFISTLHGG